MPRQDKEFTRQYWEYQEREEREAVFKDAIGTLFGEVANIDQFATIAVALAKVDACNHVFRKSVDPLLQAEYNRLLNASTINNNNNNNATTTAQGGNKLTNAFINLMQPYGFSTVQGVVFAGDAGAAFMPVVGNGVLFKDGTGPTHGEYSHSLQWLLLCTIRGALKLPQNMAQFYSTAVSYPSLYEVEEEMGRTKRITLWDFLVDCVLDESSPREHLTANILSNSWRSPAYVTRTLVSGALQDTWTGQHLQGRIAKRGKRFGEDYRTMRYHHHAKQHGKGEQMVRVSMAWIPRQYLDQLGIAEKAVTSEYVKGTLVGREVEVKVDLVTNSVILPLSLAQELGITDAKLVPLN